MWGQIAGMAGGMMGGGGGGGGAEAPKGKQVSDMKNPMTGAQAPSSNSALPAATKPRSSPNEKMGPKQHPAEKPPSEPQLATRQDTNQKLAMGGASEDLNSKGGVSLGGMF